MILNIQVQLNPALKIVSLKFINPKPVAIKSKKQLVINCHLTPKTKQKKQIIERLLKKCLSSCDKIPVWDLVDPTSLTEFQKQVYQALLLIKPGQTKSYLEMAQDIGAPKAIRAVGQALKFNPFPILFPCHRVIKTSGDTGGFSGGADLKVMLLQFESKQE